MANSSDSSPAAAIDQCDAILEMIEEEVPERAWDKARDFLESVQTGVAGVRETIVRTNRVTDKQQTALDNWERAVDKWVNPNG